MKFLFLILLLSAILAGAQVYKPKRIELYSDEFIILDGDTLLINGQRIRLLGIDAPEMGQKPFGENSKNYLKQITQNNKIYCRSSNEPFDKYKRLLAYCWSKDKFINAEMIKSGWAISLFIGEKNLEFKPLFLELEENAQEKELGIYNPKEPLPEIPYIWRRQNKSKRGIK